MEPVKQDHMKSSMHLVKKQEAAKHPPTQLKQHQQRKETMKYPETKKLNSVQETRQTEHN